MNMKKIGFNFLETHPQLQEHAKLDREHVIVDKSDYDIILNWLNNNPEIGNYIIKGINLKYNNVVPMEDDSKYIMD